MKEISHPQKPQLADWGFIPHAVVFAVAGTCGLILLSIFDTLRHPRLHDGFLLLFVAGYVISAIFIWSVFYMKNVTPQTVIPNPYDKYSAEYQRLGVHFRQHRILRLSFWAKLIFVLLEIILAIVFGATSYKGRPNVGAVIEWIVALIFTFYALTFFMDLLPASRSAQEHENGKGGRERGAENGGFVMDGTGVDGGQTPMRNF